ncbi:phage tail tape measure protein [Streptomyces sp. NBC_00102]|uniref:phage tail tape measure protein n=1 Tax=Streptomyces sp. NBC_00102 TaxID=2975652 RepID=UPI00224FD598|nr:phage tail tape measure protein [Streptomyces sp. NBC_00102]MCX5398469.1 phage tail tape measure protein [Streptomyces sp. NBC_00102]
MAVEVGVGYVSVVPEVQGFARELEQQVTGPSASAGESGGEAAGEGFTGKMGGALAGGMLTIGIAAAAVLTKGLMDALDQSAINGKIQATLGSTPEQAGRYGKAAGQLYAHGVTDSVEEAADALSGVMRAGILPPDATNAQIESITGKVTDLSKTFELDLGQTSNAVGQILKNGLAKDGAEALDILTVGMQKMGPRADDMADTFNEYSTKFRDLGLSAADAMGLMSQGMQAGARDTDVVADALKEFQIRATDGSSASKAAYEAIGLNAAAMTKKVAKGGAGAREGLQQVLDGLKAIKDPAERSAASVGLFGTKSEDLGQALYALNPRTAVKALGDTAGAAEKMGDALHENAGAKVDQFKRTLEVGVTNFMGDHVIPALASFGDFLGAKLGPALNSGKSLVSGFFHAFTGSAGGTAINSFADSVVGAGTTLRENFLPGIRSLASVAQTAVLPALKGLGGVLVNQLAPAFMTLYTHVVGAVVPILSALGRILLEVIWPAVMRVYASIAENLQPIFSALSEFISQRVAPAATLIGKKLREVVDKARPLISVVTSLISWLARLAANILGAVVPVLIRLAGPLFTALIKAVGGAISRFGSLIGWLSSVATSLRNAAKSVQDFAVSAVAKFATFNNYVRGMPARIKGYLGNFGSLLISKGADLARGIWVGIRSMGSWLKSQLYNWAKSVIPGPIAEALGINSPSRLMADKIGRWIPPGVVDGIDAEQSTLDARLRSMVTVPDVRVPSVAVAAPPTPGATWVAELGRLLAEQAERVPDVVLKVGGQEIARAVAGGQRQLARR